MQEHEHVFSFQYPRGLVVIADWLVLVDSKDKAWFGVYQRINDDCEIVGASRKFDRKFL